MSLVGAGLAEILVVDRLDLRVVMRLSVGQVEVVLIQRLRTQSLEVNEVANVTGLDGLTAAVDTAAGAAHDLNELIVSFTCADLVEDDSSVLQTGGNGYLNGHAGDIIGRFLDTVGTANFFVVDLLEIFAGQNVSNGSERCFHNAAGRAEDGACAGADRHDRIKLVIGKIGELDTRGLDHLRKLSGGDGDVVVLHTVATLIVTGDLELLGYAGHDRYDNDVVRIDAGFLCIIALDHSALHLLRRFAGGQMGEKVGIVVLAELDPAGGAGGDHRQCAAFLDSLDELGALFHNGEVSAEVGVKYFVKAQHLERGDHLAGDVGADRHTEALA